MLQLSRIRQRKRERDREVRMREEQDRGTKYLIKQSKASDKI